MVTREEATKKTLEIAGVDKLELDKVITNYYGKLDLAKQILEIQPIYFDESKLWWFWDKKRLCWELTDETHIMNLVSNLTTANTVKLKEKGEILESLKQKSRLNKPQEPKKTWIQFRNKIVDIENGEMIEISSKFFITNPIPWKLGQNGETPTIDKIFTEWVGEKYVKTLYQIISYCLLIDYPIHRMFCFIGGGLNGKSCFLNLLRKFIGKENCTSTELDVLINSRFEVTRLHKKLVCQMGETNFSEMNKTSMIKKLSGNDLIGFEYKNKTPFEDTNYAKILISTNNLPTTSDKTIGFYRRWLIMDFPNQFSEKIDILDTIPKEEYENLGFKSVFILRELLKDREFHNEGNIEERMKKYEDHSDPLEKFLNEFTDTNDPNKHIFKWEFEKRLNGWLVEHRFRGMSDRTISKKMKEKGVVDDRVTAEWYDNYEKIRKQVRAWVGIQWKS